MKSGRPGENGLAATILPVWLASKKRDLRSTMSLGIDEIKGQLIQYIEEKCLVKFDGQELTAETNLFDSNVIDSFEVIELIVFLESKFGVKLTDEDLLSPVLSSVATMAEFVHTNHAET